MPKNNFTLYDNDAWQTPKDIVDLFGEFDYDPTATPETAKRLNIPNYDTIDTDGLKSDWAKYKRIWLNPPFTRKVEFYKKAWETYEEAHNEIFIVVPENFMTSARFHNTFHGGKIFFPNGRIKFINPVGARTYPAFGSVVIKLQDKWEIEMINITNLKSMLGVRALRHLDNKTD